MKQQRPAIQSRIICWSNLSHLIYIGCQSVHQLWQESNSASVNFKGTHHIQNGKSTSWSMNRAKRGTLYWVNSSGFTWYQIQVLEISSRTLNKSKWVASTYLRGLSDPWHQVNCLDSWSCYQAKPDELTYYYSIYIYKTRLLPWGLCLLGFLYLARRLRFHKKAADVKGSQETYCCAVHVWLVSFSLFPECHFLAQFNSYSDTKNHCCV